MAAGISAYDRAHTIRTAVKPDASPKDLSQPGHVFPLRALEGGVLRRAGHTEAVVDISKLAGLYPAGVLCEIMDDDGTMEIIVGERARNKVLCVEGVSPDDVRFDGA